MDTQVASEPLKLIKLLTLMEVPLAAPVDKTKEMRVPEALAV